MGTFGMGTACPSLASRSAGRAGRWAWCFECSVVYQFVLSALGALPKSSSVLGCSSHPMWVCGSSWSSCVCACRAASCPWAHLAWGKQVFMWAQITVVAMAQNLEVKKWSEKLTVPVLDAVLVIHSSCSYRAPAERAVGTIIWGYYGTIIFSLGKDCSFPIPGKD